MYPKERQVYEKKDNPQKDRNYHYRRIEAMYHKGYSIDQMIKESRGLSRVEVLDIIQTIFALLKMKEEGIEPKRKKHSADSRKCHSYA